MKYKVGDRVAVTRRPYHYLIDVGTITAMAGKTCNIEGMCDFSRFEGRGKEMATQAIRLTDIVGYDYDPVTDKEIQETYASLGAEHESSDLR